MSPAAEINRKFLDEAARYSRHIPLDNFIYSVNISLKYKYIYVETPKVACSTIKLTLQRLELEDKDFTREDPEDVHHRNFSPLLNPLQVGSLDKFFHRKDIFKFCFVRNPYERLLSCYLDKIAGNKPQKSSILMQLGHNPGLLETPVSFEEFVSAVGKQPVLHMDPHWRVQYYQTMQGEFPYDFIGRLENFSEDIRHVGEKISKDFFEYYHHEKRHKTMATKRMADYYTNGTIKQVREIYKKDFEAFGYSGDLPA